LLQKEEELLRIEAEKAASARIQEQDENNVCESRPRRIAFESMLKHWRMQD